MPGKSVSPVDAPLQGNVVGQYLLRKRPGALRGGQLAQTSDAQTASELQETSIAPTTEPVGFSSGTSVFGLCYHASSMYSAVSSKRVVERDRSLPGQRFCCQQFIEYVMGLPSLMSPAA